MLCYLISSKIILLTGPFWLDLGRRESCFFAVAVLVLVFIVMGWHFGTRHLILFLPSLPV